MKCNFKSKEYNNEKTVSFYNFIINNNKLLALSLQF